MHGYETPGTKIRTRPYKTLREDPRYDELRKIIDELSPEKIEKLKSYIRNWSHKDR